MNDGAGAARRGLFLDLDGTLADTLGVLRQAYRDFLARFGAAGSEREFESLNGPPIPEIVARLQTVHRLPGTVTELTALYRSLMEEAHDVAAPHEGAAELVNAAHERRWVVAVVTSNPHAATHAWLTRVGLADEVAVVVGGDEVARGKPDPEPYRIALARSRCAAAASLAIEDGVQGALAAIGAGIPTWQIGAEAAAELVGQPLFRGTLSDLRAALRLL